MDPSFRSPSHQLPPRAQSTDLPEIVSFSTERNPVQRPSTTNLSATAGVTGASPSGSGKFVIGKTEKDAKKIATTLGSIACSIQRQHERDRRVADVHDLRGTIPVPVAKKAAHHQQPTLSGDPQQLRHFDRSVSLEVRRLLTKRRLSPSRQQQQQHRGSAGGRRPLPMGDHQMFQQQQQHPSGTAVYESRRHEEDTAALSPEHYERALDETTDEFLDALQHSDFQHPHQQSHMDEEEHQQQQQQREYSDEFDEHQPQQQQQHQQQQHQQPPQPTHKLERPATTSNASSISVTSSTRIAPSPVFPARAGASSMSKELVPREQQEDAQATSALMKSFGEPRADKMALFENPAFVHVSASRRVPIGSARGKRVPAAAAAMTAAGALNGSMKQQAHSSATTSPNRTRSNPAAVMLANMDAESPVSRRRNRFEMLRGRNVPKDDVVFKAPAAAQFTYKRTFHNQPAPPAADHRGAFTQRSLLNANARGGVESATDDGTFPCSSGEAARELLHPTFIYRRSSGAGLLTAEGRAEQTHVADTCIVRRELTDDAGNVVSEWPSVTVLGTGFRQNGRRLEATLQRYRQELVKTANNFWTKHPTPPRRPSQIEKQLGKLAKSGGVSPTRRRPGGSPTTKSPTPTRRTSSPPPPAAAAAAASSSSTRVAEADA